MNKRIYCKWSAVDIEKHRNLRKPCKDYEIPVFIMKG